MLIIHDIDQLIFNLLQIREILTYAVISTGTNKLAKKSDAYCALIRQLSKNHQCSLEDLTIATINDDNHKLLDLLEKSGAGPCKYFQKEAYDSLINKGALKTIIWFDKQLGLNLDLDEAIHHIILAACQTPLSEDHNEMCLQTIKDHKEFFLNNSEKIQIYIDAALILHNYKAADWFYQEYPILVGEYVDMLISLTCSSIWSERDIKPIIRWLTKHGHLESLFDKMQHHKHLFYSIKIAVIESSAPTDLFADKAIDILGNKAIDILKANSDFIYIFVSNSSLINKYEPILLPYLSKIDKHIYAIIGRIIVRNDIKAFNWICSHRDIVIHKNNVDLAFGYGCEEIIQYSIDNNYTMNDPIHCLKGIARLGATKTEPLLKLFKKMEPGFIAKEYFDAKEHVTELIYDTLYSNNPVFLEWLFKYYKISPDYFTVEHLHNIFNGLITYKNINITQFFVNHGYKIYFNRFPSAPIYEKDHDFIRYILKNQAIKKKYDLVRDMVVEKIISMNDLELLQWFMESYLHRDAIVRMKRVMIYAIVHGTDQITLWFLNYVQQENKIKIIRNSQSITEEAMLCGRTKILDWLIANNFEITFDTKLIDKVITNKMFNVIYYLRELGFKINIPDSSKSDT